MQKIILNLLFIATLGLLFPACSKKTTTAETTVNNQQQRAQRSGDQQRGQRKGPPQFADLLTQMDTDKDGRLSITETTGKLKNDFSRIDGDSDGFITEEEFKAAGPPQRKKRN